MTEPLQVTNGPMEKGMEQRKLETSGSYEAPSRRAAHCASLSVILLSVGDRAKLERALSTIAGRCRRLEAEIIVVRKGSADDLHVLSATYPRVIFLDAPDSSTTVGMRELGMEYAVGDIIALRNDDAVGDGGWLSVFDAMVGIIDDTLLTDTEVAMPPISVDSIASFEHARRQSKTYATPNAPVRLDLRGDATFASSLLPLVDTPAPSQREI
jgi:hypothetical protein